MELWLFRIEGSKRIDFLHRWDISKETAQKIKELVEKEEMKKP